MSSRLLRSELGNTALYVTNYGLGTLAAIRAITSADDAPNWNMSLSLTELCEYIFRDSERMLSRGIYYIESDFFSEIVRDAQLLARDQAYVKATESGHYQLFNVTRGDLVYALGLRSGDVLLGVNGQELATIDGILTAYADNAQETEFVLTVMRGDGVVRLSYALADW